jgi:putative transposase
VARELDALVRVYGKPACIVSDNGTEFTSKAILKWANENGVEWHYELCPKVGDGLIRRP